MAARSAVAAGIPEGNNVQAAATAPLSAAHPSLLVSRHALPRGSRLIVAALGRPAWLLPRLRLLLLDNFSGGAKPSHGYSKQHADSSSRAPQSEVVMAGTDGPAMTCGLSRFMLLGERERAHKAC